MKKQLYSPNLHPERIPNASRTHPERIPNELYQQKWAALSKLTFSKLRM